jgi:CBS domain-containing protein
VVSGDKLLCEALQIMHSEGISSIAVVDNHFNVVGNISTTDVKVCHRFFQAGRQLAKR